MRVLRTVTIVALSIFLFSKAYGTEILKQDSNTIFFTDKELIKITASYDTLDPNLISRLTATMPLKNQNSEFVLSEKMHIPHFEPYQVSAGIPAVSFNLKTHKIGVFDSIAPLNFTRNYNQWTTIDWIPKADGTFDKSINYWSYAWSVGIIITKAQGDSDAVFGLNITPFLLRFNNYSIGIGIDWRNSDTVSLKKENLSLVLPITYQFETK